MSLTIGRLEPVTANAKEAGATLDVERNTELHLGRAPRCHLRLQDKGQNIIARHAALVGHDAATELRSLAKDEACAPIRVDGVPLAPRASVFLADGSNVTIGTFGFRFTSVLAPVPAPAPAHAVASAPAPPPADAAAAAGDDMEVDAPAAPARQRKITKRKRDRDRVRAPRDPNRVRGLIREPLFLAPRQRPREGAPVAYNPERWPTALGHVTYELVEVDDEDEDPEEAYWRRVLPDDERHVRPRKW